jgi:hypothetical protein
LGLSLPDLADTGDLLLVCKGKSNRLFLQLKDPRAVLELELITMMKLGVGRTLDLGYYSIGF